MSGFIINPYAFGAAAFSPADVSGLVLWLDADDSSTITLNGSNVSGWADKSTSENDAAQGVTSLQPARVTNELNGRTVLRFDGTADRMTCPTAVWTGAAARTMFTVYKSTRTGNYVDAIAGQATSTTNGTWFNIQSRTATVVGDPYLAGYAQDLTGPTPDNAWKIAAASYTGTNSFAYKNGSQTNTGARTLNTSNDVFRIGHTSGADLGSYLLGDIAEIICYDTALGATDRANVTAYLGTKWGITVS